MPSGEIDYGSGPAHDEIELTLFGPGYGEAIAVHLGAARWLLVDSCIAPGAAVAASADYLDRLGISPGSVKAVVASHWHDDHVRGLSGLVKKYATADFFLPAVFADKQSTAFLAAYSGRECSGLSRGTKELYDSLVARESSVAVKSRCEIFHDRSQPIPVQVVAYSPTDAAFAQFLGRILSYVPKENADMPIETAPEISPNLSSIVLHIELGSASILLGADLERDKTAGWDVITPDHWCNARSQAGLFKVAHHGSASGDHPDIWCNLLSSAPVALMSPFNNGRQALPTAIDRDRILARTSAAYITSTASRRPQLPTDQLKRLQDIATNLRPIQSGFGAVRARCRVGSSSWQIEMFGSAGTLRSLGNVAA